MTMEVQAKTMSQTPRRAPWNKGKLTGQKRTQDPHIAASEREVTAVRSGVWSVRHGPATDWSVHRRGQDCVWLGTDEIGKVGFWRHMSRSCWGMLHASQA